MKYRSVSQWATLHKIWQSYNIVAIPLILLGFSYSAFAIPVTITWDAPIAQGSTYSLEVGNDVGFSKTLLNQQVSGQSFAWDAPGEGVYHWRLGRLNSSDSQEGGEQSSFASGSFAILDHTKSREKPAKLMWQGAPEITQYRLFVTGASGVALTMVTSTPSIIFSEVREGTAVVVAPFRGEEAGRALQMDPTLTLDTGMPPSPEEALPAPPPAVVITEEAPQQMRTPPTSKIRAFSIYGFAGRGRETLALSKLETTVKAQENFSVLGAGLRGNPGRGIMFNTLISYHDFADSSAELIEAKEKTQRVRFVRYGADLSVAYNLLDSFDLKSHALALGLAGSALQLPFLSDEPFEAKLIDTLPLKQKQRSAMGGYLGYMFQGQKVGFTLEGCYLWEDSTELTIFSEQASLDLLITESFSLGLNAFYRREDGVSCSEDPALCLARGKSATSSSQMGVALSAGKVLF